MPVQAARQTQHWRRQQRRRQAPGRRRGSAPQQSAACPPTPRRLLLLLLNRLLPVPAHDHATVTHKRTKHTPSTRTKHTPHATPTRANTHAWAHTHTARRTRGRYDTRPLPHVQACVCMAACAREHKHAHTHTIPHPHGPTRTHRHTQHACAGSPANTPLAHAQPGDAGLCVACVHPTARTCAHTPLYTRCVAEHAPLVCTRTGCRV
jgi:hypothetical protein